MTFTQKIGTALAVATLGVAPMAMASGAVAHTSSSHTTSASHTTPAQARAYGRMCAQQGLLKNHAAAVAAGQKRTAFADCVTALAHLAHSTKVHQTSAQEACAAAGESKKHVAGHSQTDYSRCVSAGNKLLAAKRHAG